MTVDADRLNAISGDIVDAAVKIHQALGPGLLGSVYEVVLEHELKRRGYRVERQLPVPIEFEGLRFEEGFRLDLLVEDAIIVELKSLESVPRVHHKQLLTHLRLMKKPLGLLLNFGAELMKDGVHRIVNNFPNG